MKLLFVAFMVLNDTYDTSSVGGSAARMSDETGPEPWESENISELFCYSRIP